MKNSRELLLMAALLLATLVACAQTATEAPATDSPARVTRFPAGPLPDQVVLTFPGDPSTTVSVQWRTSGQTTGSAVAYMPRATWSPFSQPRPTVVPAVTEEIKDPGLSNAQTTYWHTARLTGLQPGTEYIYAVGDGTPEGWGEVRSFRTAPDASEPFSFIYLGDAQYGFTRVKAVTGAALRTCPDAGFVLMAGDLVTNGNSRDDWDDFLVHTSPLLGRVPVIPTIGNHECKSEKAPRMYLQTFDLPRNGPESLTPERVYSLTYANTLIVVLDSMLPPGEQAEWLDRVLGESKATWKLVMFHHPPYSSEPKRDNKEIRETWVPLFDKHHVDLVFNGHDHAYMRTYPLRGGERVSSPAEGTIYLISVAGTKMYEQAQRDYMQVAFTDTATYAVIDVLPATEKAGDKLVYRAWDLEGNLRDQFVLQKNEVKAR